MALPSRPFTQFPNAVLEKILRTRLTYYELKIILAIVRLTYGYQAEGRQLARLHLVGLTGISSRNVSRTVDSLIHRHIVVKIRDPANPKLRMYGLVYDLDSWQ